MAQHEKDYVDDRKETIIAFSTPTVDMGPQSDTSNQNASSNFSEQETSDILKQSASNNTKPINKFVLYTRRFLRNKLAVLGLVIFLLLTLLAVFGKFTAQWAFDDPDFFALSAPPSPAHWFGTNSSGNDLYAMVIHGLGRSLTIAVIVSVVTTAISAIVGTAAALFGGRSERIILALIHFLLVIPSFLIIALLVSGSGGDWKMLIVVLIAFGWVYYARVIWSMSISLREREYVKAAKYMGVSSTKIIARHMIPNIGSLLIINLTLGVVSTVMSETGLSFLGLGVKIPDVSLGTLLATGSNSLESAPWEFYFPAAVLTLLTVSMAFIADGLRDALDPNSAAGGKA